MAEFVLPSPRRDRGCDYCADDQNMFYGHVEQVASNEERRTILLCCPRCAWFYEIHPTGAAEAQPMTEEEARARFTFE